MAANGLRPGSTALVLAVVVVAVVWTGAAGEPGAASPAADRSALEVGDQPTPETDNTVTRVAVRADGSATWTIRIRTRLSTDEEVEEYRAFQEAFRENTSRYVDGFEESMTAVVEGAASETGRDMTASGFGAETSIQTVPRRWGVVTYRFEWTGFAAERDGRLVVGDVFEGGLFIAEGDVIEVVAPDGFRVASAAPDPDERNDATVEWIGREDFADRRPRVVMGPAEDAEVGDATDTASQGATPLPIGTVLGGIAVIAAVVLAGVGVRRWRRTRTRGPTGAGGDIDDGESELLSDEERVRRLLADRDGRMRQKDIADEFGWSKSKTSRVLGRMAEAGEVEKLRIGRENVIDLAESAEGDRPR